MPGYGVLGTRRHATWLISHFREMTLMQNKHHICIHLHVPGDASLRLCWNNTQTVNLVFADQDPNLYPGLRKKHLLFFGCTVFNIQLLFN